jgi:4-carboxymuconolactone decarboxylase
MALQVGANLMSEQMKAALEKGDLPALEALLPVAVTTPLRHPRLAGRFMAYSGVLLREGTLQPRWRELLILRTLWRTGFHYEWLWHVHMSPRHNINSAEVEAVTEGAGAPGWTSLEADLLEAADQLIDRYTISDQTWSALAAQLDEQQLIEVPYVVGTYTCLAMAFKSFRLQPEAAVAVVEAPSVPNL